MEKYPHALSLACQGKFAYTMTYSTMKYAASSFRSEALRFFACAVVLITMFFMTACGSGKEKDAVEEDPSLSSHPEEKQASEAPSETTIAETSEFPALTGRALERLVGHCAQIRAEGEPDRVGVLVGVNTRVSGLYEHHIICDLPSVPESILCAFGSQGSFTVTRAHFLATLPNGLQVYRFTWDQRIPAHASGASNGNAAFYVCGLEASGPLADEGQASIGEELAVLRKRRSELLAALPDRPDPSVQEDGPTSREEMEIMRSLGRNAAGEYAEISQRIPELEAQLALAIKGVEVRQVAVAATLEELTEDTPALAGTVLAARDGRVLAVRHDGRWVFIEEVLETAYSEPARVTLNLRGSRNQVHLSCMVDWAVAFGEIGCSIIAATTYELESLEGGSLEERLANVEPEPMATSRSSSSINKALRWNGTPTSVWIRIIPDHAPDKPIIDEVIEINFTDRLQARWGRQPSSIIAIPEPEPDTPPDLAGEAAVLDAKGTILDLVAAGDGSVLMVQTDKPPYWQPLDLKAGLFMETPWSAGPDTLLAARAGEVHLIDRKTGIVETWDIDGQTRSGLQILQLDGEIVAVAASLSAPDAPVLFTTTKEGAFVDPVNFEVLANGFDMSPVFSREDKYHGPIPQLDPESIRVRASHDGALFAVFGETVTERGRGQGTRGFQIIVDPTSAVHTDSARGTHLPSRGRLISASFPDHGGKAIQLRTTAGSDSFPGPAGTIVFAEAGSQQALAQLRGAPVVPPDPRNADGPLAHDRGLYFDSTLGVLVIPEERKLHLIPVNMPQQPLAEPQFNFAGEKVRIPLPQGSNHKASAEIGGDITIDGTEILWSIPVDAPNGNANLQLEWTGELGSMMNGSFTYNITGQTVGRLSVESSDGRATLPLRRTGIIAGAGSISGFAGSGHVMLTTTGNRSMAWSLGDYRLLFSVEERAQMFFGDADQLYILDGQGVLKAHDLLTGELINEAALASSHQGRASTTTITTGISSRLPLLAAERVGSDAYLQLINRHTLESYILDFPRETHQQFFVPHFTTNPSGRTTWSNNLLLSRDGPEISVRPIDARSVNASPDKSGRYVVTHHGILDTGSEPPAMIYFSDLPGGDRMSLMSVDVSGEYVLLRLSDSATGVTAVSVRDIRSPADELFKIRSPSLGETSRLMLISGIGRLISPPNRNASRHSVFELDVPAILRDLSDTGHNP